MFGLTEQEIEIYRMSAQDFAVQDVTPQIVSNATFMTPIISRQGEKVPDREHVIKMVSDVEEIVVLTATHMAYEYAYLQAESDMEELEIIKFLHDKYIESVFVYMIKIGIACPEEALTEIVSEIILELPWLYSRALDEDKVNVEEFLESKLDAYNNYMQDFPSDLEDDEDDWDDDEDWDEDDEFED